MSRRLSVLRFFHGAGLFRPASFAVLGDGPRSRPPGHCRVLFLPLLALALAAVFPFEAHARVIKRPALFKLFSPFVRASDSDSVSVVELESEPEPGAAVPLLDAITEVSVRSTQFNEGEGEYRCFGSFRVTNKDKVSFILQLVFANGGALTLERGRGRGGAFIAVKNWELRYKDADEQPVIKKMEQLRKDDGHVYEVRFLPEYMQEKYEFELWGMPPKEREVRRAIRGAYLDEATIAIEPMPVVR